jgi:hypothetical protein
MPMLIRWKSTSIGVPVCVEPKLKMLPLGMFFPFEVSRTT